MAAADALVFWALQAIGWTLYAVHWPIYWMAAWLTDNLPQRAFLRAEPALLRAFSVSRSVVRVAERLFVRSADVAAASKRLRRSDGGR